MSLTDENLKQNVALQLRQDHPKRTELLKGLRTTSSIDQSISFPYLIAQTDFLQYIEIITWSHMYRTKQKINQTNDPPAFESVF